MDLKDLNPAKHALSLFDEFREFAFERNVIDLAVGVRPDMATSGRAPPSETAEVAARRPRCSSRGWSKECKSAMRVQG